MVLGIVGISLLTGLLTGLIQLNPVKTYLISKIEDSYNQTFESGGIHFSGKKLGVIFALPFGAEHRGFCIFQQV